MPKIGDVSFEMDDLSEKGQRMTGDLMYLAKHMSELEAEIRLLSVARAELLSEIKKEFIKNDPFT